MHYQRARILVNWKFLSTSKDITGSNQCWSIVIEAALDIMRLQHRMAEESDVLDASRPTGLVESCFINNGYFLAASIACFLVQHRKDRLSDQDLWEVRSLLERCLGIWNRTNDLSREASKVVTALRIVLGTPEEPSTRDTIDVMVSPRAGRGENQPNDCSDLDLANLARAPSQIPLTEVKWHFLAAPPSLMTCL